MMSLRSLLAHEIGHAQQFFLKGNLVCEIRTTPGHWETRSAFLDGVELDPAVDLTMLDLTPLERAYGVAGATAAGFAFESADHGQSLADIYEVQPAAILRHHHVSEQDRETIGGHSVPLKVFQQGLALGHALAVANPAGQPNGIDARVKMLTERGWIHISVMEMKELTGQGEPAHAEG